MKRQKKFFIHPSAIVETTDIGKGTRIWAFCHVLKGAKIGSNCNIGDNCYVESDVKIGNNVVIKNGVNIWNKIVIEDNVFVGPGVVFTNDLFPRSKLYKEYIPTTIKKGASIGANATLLCGIVIGEYAMIGAGSVVTKSVPDFALVYGNPASLQGYVCKCGLKLNFANNTQYKCSCGLVYSFENSVITLKSL